MSSSLTGYTHGGWAGRQRVGFENQFSQGIAGSTPASSAFARRSELRRTCPLRSCKGELVINMNTKQNQQISIGGAVVFRDYRGKRQFLLVRQKDGKGWEIPKVTIRKGESSVRAVIRMTSEQGGMTVRVLDEAGRFSGTTVVNNKTIPQRFYYYLILQKGGSSEMIGFDEFKWAEYGESFKKITTKKEKEMLKGGRETLKEWEKTHTKQQLVI